MRKSIKILLIILTVCIVFVAGISIYFVYAVTLSPPVCDQSSVDGLKRVKLNDSLFVCEDSWLKQESGGIYELYVQGAPYEIGFKNGLLTKELNYIQEGEFIKFIKTVVPSDGYLNFLKYFIAWFNKDLDEYIPLEYRQEILGISQNSASEFNFISEPYHRILNYHAAHDVGHAVSNMNLVKCTSFGIQNDSTLLVGRNLDFFAGDGFAQNKLVSFYSPAQGYKFAMVSWAGMIGVISGMNMEGLSISLNSANSDIPTSAKKPVSIIAREVLQYASNIDQAFEIIKNSESFVSEMFMIGSAADGKVAIVEKTLDTTVLYYSEKDYILLTNHFQSEALKNSAKNKESIAEGISSYRYERLEELVRETKPNSPEAVAAILRNKNGLKNTDIGYINEKAVNQLIAHHGVIFDLRKRILWVSQYPYQLGALNAYELPRIFADTFAVATHPVISRNLSIAEDPFLRSTEFANVLKFRESTDHILKCIKNNTTENVSAQDISQYLLLNPEYFGTYYTVAQYYQAIDVKDKALFYYKKALEKDVVGESTRARIIAQIKNIESPQ